MDSMKTKHPKLWKQLKEIAEKHDMKLSEFNASAFKSGGEIEYVIGIGEYGYDDIGYIVARAYQNENDRVIYTRETLCKAQNGKLNEEQLEKISNLLEGKQNG